jgi:hypothetical protein
LLPLLFSHLAYAAPCTTPVLPSDITAKVENAMITWATLDEDGFSESADAILAAVPCLSAPLSPAQAAGVHRVRALQAFLAGESESAVLAFRAAIAAEPTYTLSEKLAPQGGKLWRLYQQAVDAGRPGAGRLVPPDGYVAYVDGTRLADRSEIVPSIVQLEGGGKTEWSRYLEPAAPFAPEGLPTLRVLADLDEPGGKPVKPPKEPQGGGGSGAALWAASGTSGLVAAGLFGAAAGLRSSFNKAPTQGKMSAVNGTYFGSIGMLVVAGGLAAAAASQ